MKLDALVRALRALPELGDGRARVVQVIARKKWLRTGSQVELPPQQVLLGRTILYAADSLVISYRAVARMVEGLRSEFCPMVEIKGSTVPTAPLISHRAASLLATYDPLDVAKAAREFALMVVEDALDRGYTAPEAVLTRPDSAVRSLLTKCHARDTVSVCVDVDLEGYADRTPEDVLAAVEETVGGRASYATTTPSGGIHAVFPAEAVDRDTSQRVAEALGIPKGKVEVLYRPMVHLPGLHPEVVLLRP